jgi:Leucine-rich repeat (LRR) protein
MMFNELYEKLKDAYSINNLNKISLTLINLHKNEQYAILRKISEMISDYVDIKINEEGKGFNKLIMLYHPDRANHHLGEVERLYQEGNLKDLQKFSHILQLERIEEIALVMDGMEDIDYSPVYEWDFDTDTDADNEGYTIVDYYEPARVTRQSLSRYSFYDAVKIREYGQTNIEYPTYYLEDFEEFELSSSEINDLDGVQFCIHARSLDLSDNMIYDLNHLICLPQLEDLNLSSNRIGDIDTLGYLKNLKTLDLSNNRINDISPLMELEYLEYVSLTGNPVKKSQIVELVDKGIAVDY